MSNMTKAQKILIIVACTFFVIGGIFGIIFAVTETKAFLIVTLCSIAVALVAFFSGALVGGKKKKKNDSNTRYREE